MTYIFSGCYVPAEYASIKPTHMLLSRLCSSDNLESNSSAFLCEMAELAYILEHLEATNGEGCLIIIDEAGRGTYFSLNIDLNCQIVPFLMLSV